MIVIYSLCAAVWVYLAALGGLQFVQRLQKMYGTSVGNTISPKPNHSISSPTEIKTAKGTPPIGKESTCSDDTLTNYAPLPQRKKRVIVAMTGATGAILGIRLLEKLRDQNIETHLIISRWAAATITYETDHTLAYVRLLATKVYASNDVAAPISSGSFKIDGMIVVPCSMKTLSAIANGYGDDLISRAADVTFKERRKLILVARETPLSGIHLENMLRVTRNGAVIFPPVPAFYGRPTSVGDIVEQSVGRMLDLIDVDAGGFERWGGMKKKLGEKRKE